MRRSTSIPELWDAEFMKERMQLAVEETQDALFVQDWQAAEISVRQKIADLHSRHRVCALSRCRRARRCIGNAPLCWRSPLGERQPGKVQDWIEGAYVAIQQERAAAAQEARVPRVLPPARMKRGRAHGPQTPSRKI